jgi:hypothetical protein
MTTMLIGFIIIGLAALVSLIYAWYLWRYPADPGIAVVVFDEKCGFCRSVARVFHWLGAGRILLLDWTTAASPSSDPEAVAKGLTVVQALFLGYGWDSHEADSIKARETPMVLSKNRWTTGRATGWHALKAVFGRT